MTGATSGTSKYAGGVVGNAATSSGASVKNCYNRGTVDAGCKVGGGDYIGSNSSIAVSGSFVTPAQIFHDLSDGAWYRDPIAYVIENGLMSGVSQRTFDPEGTTTRGMAMTWPGRSRLASSRATVES